MSNSVTNQPSAWAAFRRWYYIIAALMALALGLMWLLGHGPGGSSCKVAAPIAVAPAAAVAPVVAMPAPVVAAVPAAAASVVAAAPAPAPVVVAAAPAAAALVGVPSANVYFASDRFKLPQGTKKTLGEVVAYLKKNDGAKVHLSGYHDPSGNTTYNEALAQNRARAVRGALQAMGVARDRVVMEKPTVTTGSGDPKEARRVEARIK